MARPLYKNMTVQVLTAIALGMAVGHVRPAWGLALQPAGDGFIRLVKMVVGPIIFLTIVVGIASMGDLKKVGRVGGKALIYFEVITTIALALGMVVANVLRPGAGITAAGPPPGRTAATQPVAVATAATTTGPATTPSPAAVPIAPNAQVEPYAKEAAKPHTFSDFVLNIIPDNVFAAFANGNLLQILFFSVLFGLALASLGLKTSGLMVELEHLTEVMFRVVALVMKLAPVGAFGAMAYTVGKFGLAALLPLAKLMGCIYLTMVLFVVVVLGVVCRLAGFSLWGYLKFIKEEIFLVLGTSTSESALPRMIEKLELMGCSRGVVGMVIPAGYSFNLDGTSIYLSMGFLFLVQAYGVPLTFGQQAWVLITLMLTSKGAAAVTGSGLVTLAATLTATGVMPVENLALIIGVDRFMSEARSITNLIGNGVATIVVSKWEGEFDPDRYRAAMAGHALAVPGFPVEVAADVAREPNAGPAIRP